MDKIIVLIGAPGAGKGTQARLLFERRGIPQISTGDIFREMKNADTPLANEIKEIMAAGKLISDDLTFRVVQERTSRNDCKGTFLLDGFPRTIKQAELLEKLAVDQKKPIHAIEIEVPTELIEKRMTGRRNCPVCGEIYNVFFKPPKREDVCDLHPDAKLVHREDDYEEKVRVRLATYREQTEPLIDYYEKSSRLDRVNGNAEVESIYKAFSELV
jgi:adenylate kinase